MTFNPKRHILFPALGLCFGLIGHYGITAAFEPRSATEGLWLYLSFLAWLFLLGQHSPLSVVGLFTIPAILRKFDIYYFSPDAWSLLLAAAVISLISLNGWLRPDRWTRQRPFLGLFGVLSLNSILLAIVAWLIASTVESSRWKKPMKLEAHAPDEGPNRGLRIGLALSGGGYRAALMHAGVVSALQELHVRPTHLSAVSGGAIFASYYTLGGDPHDFLRAAEMGRFDLRRFLASIYQIGDLFNRETAQGDLLAAAFLGDTKLADIRRAGRPMLLIGATDLTTGKAIGIGDAFFIGREPLAPYEKHHFPSVTLPQSYTTTEFEPFSPGAAERVYLKDVVVASGAFPLAFNAVELAVKCTGFVERDVAFLLTDGGVADNSGIDLLLDAHRESGGSSPDLIVSGKMWPQLDGWELDYLISSDAGALFERSAMPEGISQFGRAIDIIYRNTRSREIRPYSPLPNTALLNPEMLLKYRPDRSDFRTQFTAAQFRRLSYVNMHAECRRMLVASLPHHYGISFTETERPAKDKISAAGIKPTADALLALEAAEPNTEKGRAAHSQLSEILENDLRLCLKAFGDASTLKGRFHNDEAWQLFRLGIHLVAHEFTTISGELDFLQYHREDAVKLWEQLTSISGLTKEEIERIRMRPENELLKVFRPRLTWNGIPTVDDTMRQLVEREGKENSFNLKRSALGASLAHQLAHAILKKVTPDESLWSRRSLVEELCCDVSLPADEDKADELTVELLRKAKIDPNGFLFLMRKAVDYYGAQRVHRTTQARIDKLEKLITSKAPVSTSGGDSPGSTPAQ
jgi:predicted acylesterase/phospholipase RssA